MGGRQGGLPLLRHRRDRRRVPSPGTGWPEPGGLLPREALNLVRLVSEPGLAGIQIVECSPPYDWAEMTCLMSSRVILDSLAVQVRSGKLGRKPSSSGRVAWGPYPS
ncbi:arginase family protein [Nonomuraea diastatica]|uniref:arginase family protein n=1 Tax=Nonomuraea diastatica TaxID=1848329 RepID=UPI002482834A|nr:arginase family protein [Nonomuraea diastatica]